jgi:3-isopropylmalate dehydrogenase
MQKNIAILPGDGIGPEIIKQGVKILEAIAQKYNHKFEYHYGDIGAIAIDNIGNPLPDETLEILHKADAILFGAIGDPKYDNDPNAKVRPEQGLLRMRKELGLFANIRPVSAYSALLDASPLKRDRIEGVDMVIYRELTGGIYFGEKGKTDDAAFDTCTYSIEEIKRISQLAFEQARQRRNKVTLIDKANVLETSRLWRSVVKELHQKDYADVELDFLFVDNAAMQLILNPAQFDVILTENMFGDILSDEASVITGSIGLLPSASVGAKTALFEPIHGSFPQGAGKDIANPSATILSAAMLLDYLSMNDEANDVRNAVNEVINSGVGTPDLNPTQVIGCEAFGNLVAEIIAA